MPDTIILRFRDINQDGTVERHRKLISAAGYVWGGWWKKDSEPRRLNGLEELRARTRAEPLAIGLFDRSTGAFYCAIAIDCAFADGPIASPEPHKTPSYYSTEKVPAWFKLTSIEPLEKSIFMERFA